MTSAGTALFAAYLGKRSAIGEIVPSGHYDIVFRWVGVAGSASQRTQCHADRREASHRMPPRNHSVLVNTVQDTVEPAR
jgi:hypothetical protein